MPLDGMLLFQLLIFALTLWLGGYLVTQGGDWDLRLTGYGLLSYAILLALKFFSSNLPSGLWALPSLLWVGAALHLWPPQTRWRSAAITAWMLALVPAQILALLAPWLATLSLLALLAIAGLLLQRARGQQAEGGMALLAVVSLFLGMSTGIIVLPPAWLSSYWGLGLLGLDMLLLGLAVAWWDAFEQGQRLRQPLLRSLVASSYFAGLLAAVVLVGLAMDGGRLTPGWLLVLVLLVGLGALTPVASTPIQAGLDQLIFRRNPQLKKQRQLLRNVADNLPRLPRNALDELDEADFKRHVRQALRDLGDLARLTANPLTNYPPVAEAVADNPLERAHRLRQMLTASVKRLKPRAEEEFGVTDEWRYYNSLYFPYVVGVSPYSRPIQPEELDAATRRALDWFRQSVPERTLYNWQSTATALVAQDLLSQMR